MRVRAEMMSIQYEHAGKPVCRDTRTNTMGGARGVKEK